MGVNNCCGNRASERLDTGLSGPPCLPNETRMNTKEDTTASGDQVQLFEDMNMPISNRKVKVPPLKLIKD